ncbi:hypothetical protein N9Z79_06580, partial [Akkermansiaceae bacterium]|nr:hypothetical protein [Akkermansiaceae bacterium]
MIARIDEVIWARPLSTAMLVGILAAIVLLSLYLYRRPWGLPRWLQVVLVSFRVLVLALIVATLMEPTAVTTEDHTRVRSLPVLLDTSESMSMKDQRKLPAEIVEAASALGMVPLDEKIEADQAVM